MWTNVASYIMSGDKLLYTTQFVSIYQTQYIKTKIWEVFQHAGVYCDIKALHILKVSSRPNMQLNTGSPSVRPEFEPDAFLLWADNS